MTAHEPIFEGGKLVGVLNYVTDYFMLSDPSDKETVLVRAVRDYDPDKSCIPYGGPGADDVLHGIGSERRTWSGQITDFFVKRHIYALWLMIVSVEDITVQLVGRFRVRLCLIPSGRLLLALSRRGFGQWLCYSMIGDDDVRATLWEARPSPKKIGRMPADAEPGRVSWADRVSRMALLRAGTKDQPL